MTNLSEKLEQLSAAATQGEYRKTATIRASQWWKDGDHPAVIRKSDRHRYADEGIPWIKTLEGGHIVTPGDWIATGIQGEHWPIKPDVFAATYEPVTGQLVAVQADDATVELVARALQDMPYMADWDDLEDEDQEHMREMARIAIRALKSPKPPIL